MDAPGAVPPEETSTISTPASARRLHNHTESSRVHPPSSQSVAEIRTQMGRSCGQTCFIFSRVSKSILDRFSRLPPYSSVRLLVIGERNSLRRYPCAPWSSISSNPARSALFAASAKACWTASISARSISLGVWWVDENGMGEGAITCQPPSSLGISTRLSPPDAQVLPFLPA